MADHQPGTPVDTASSAGAVRALLQWYRPYLAGQRVRIAWVGAGTVVVLTCQAVIPGLVEQILEHGQEDVAHPSGSGPWPLTLLVVLGVLVLAQVAVGYRTRVGAHTIASVSASVLMRTLFGRLLHGRLVRQRGLRRSSVVMRMTTDVDRVGESIASTIAEGLPGVARLVIALVLLTLLEWRAGLAMIAASIVFVILRRSIGRRLLVADRRRVQELSVVSDTVDETISSARTLAGLRLLDWQSARFARTVDDLDHRTHRQGVLVSRLDIAANAAGLLGLVVVVVLGLAVGGPAIASVAAALLYVENAVRGMEALPPWIRSVQLATASQHRLDDILRESERIAVPDADPPAQAPPGLVLDAVVAGGAAGLWADRCRLEVPESAVIGLVTGPRVDPDEVLALLAGDESPDEGRVLLDRRDVRTVAGADSLRYVAHAVELPPVSALELFDAVIPGIDGDDVARTLVDVGLGHLRDLPHGVREILGPGAVELTVSERQLLVLATALAAPARLLLVGPLLALADADSALPLLATIRSGSARTTVVATADAEVAEAVDAVLYVAEGAARLAPHQRLLVDDPGYAALWEQRLSRDEIDLSVIGLDGADADRMLSRLVTEHFAPGELVYRQGAPADRILFIVSGHVEITTATGDGPPKRVAVLGPGSHCGDLRLTVGETRAEGAVALDDCVVRSLSRQAIHAGLTGLLDRTAVERRIVESILRHGPATPGELALRLDDVDDTSVAASVALLVQDGAVREEDGTLSVVMRRAGKSGASDLLDRLRDL